MDFTSQKDILWYSIKLNPSLRIDPPKFLLKCTGNVSGGNPFVRERIKPPPGPVKDLLNLSAEKLVSDVCLLRDKVCHLPVKICSILLLKAIFDGRILSLVELIKHCPFEEFKIPTHSILKKYHSSFKQPVNDKLKTHYDIVVSSFSTFLNGIVEQKKGSSQLKILDLGFAPVSCGWLVQRLNDFIKAYQEKLTKEPWSSNYRKLNPKDIKSVKEIGRKAPRSFENDPKASKPSKEYFLKCAIRVEQNHHLKEMKLCFEKLKATNLKIIFSGVFFINVICLPDEFQDFVENVNQDSKLLSIMYSAFYPRNASLTNMLEKFRYLKYLNVSKLCPDQSGALTPEFFGSIRNLTTLKRLVLSDINLTGQLLLLQCGSSQEKSDSAIVRDCCLAHCGSLQYLDVSHCSLVYSDLKFLEQLSYSKSLKCLDISENSLPLISTCQTLLLMSSSLSVLNIAYSFDEYMEYNSEIFPLSLFTELKVLKIGGLRPTITSLQMLYSELEKMNLNTLKFASEVWHGCYLACLDYLIKTGQQHVNLYNRSTFHNVT